MTETHTATVETMTAEVQVLKVGSRQITLSVAKQLDQVPFDAIEPMGRIRTGALNHLIGHLRTAEVIGRHKATGALVRAVAQTYYTDESDEELAVTYSLAEADEFSTFTASEEKDWIAWKNCYQASQLPLIVLAGLK